MPTHDYIIENQSAPNFRADLNSALQAIVSNNSSTSEPPVTYANMIWYDTTNNLLRMRNEADDAFITLGTLDQVAGTFAPAGLLNLTQAQVENSASTVFGQVSGQRLSQAGYTDAQARTAQAGHAAGSIGSYAFLRGPSTTQNNNVAGSSLRYSSSQSTSSLSGTAPLGTWKCMGVSTVVSIVERGNSSTAYFGTVWLRIS